RVRSRSHERGEARAAHPPHLRGVGRSTPPRGGGSRIAGGPARGVRSPAMTAIPSVAFARAARRIDTLADEDLPARTLLDRVSAELRAAMPIDALFMAATDPQTGLAMGAGVAHDMPQTVCRPFWEYEFEVPDFNK